MGRPARIVLFDLDLTLLRIEMDREVIAAALDAATGVPGLLDGVDYRGRSDGWLAGEVARLHGLDPHVIWPRYASAYTRVLSEALTSHGDSALPGAAGLLEALRERGDSVLGVATGNMRANAALKLASARLERFFDPLRGGFGDDHDDRADIVRAGAAACGWIEGDRLVVVGDTVHDVRAALGAGAVPIGVATGHATSAELTAAGAMVVLHSLEHDGALAAILG